jgi:hypothetical protein
MEATLARNEIVGSVVVRFVTVRTFEGANADARNHHACALAGDDIAVLYRKSLKTSLALDQPDEGHCSFSLAEIVQPWVWLYLATAPGQHCWTAEIIGESQFRDLLFRRGEPQS